ncbi:MAG: alanine--tRNA ligase, partial [Flavobacteriaceae bacterium]|nr:alanine--tRNA ligase [Flavobacteriaceae bacterium]
MKSQEVRNKFLDFFKEKNHSIVPSAPMVLKDDPTLMFVNSGMAPFKEYFLGNAEPKNNRIADTQKCLRVSGKHNDLEEVGYDTYHHTLFEMLGNWSFGDYFKKEAIAWAWELLTEEFGIDKDILYVTVFEGSDDKDKLPLDQEAYDHWKAIIPEDRILMGNKKDNFWEMGEQGPCGPCSEIHVDIRSDEEKAQLDGKELVNKDHPHVVEIWNLVFMQYNRKANGSLENLPEKHIDTGMGFERLCMVLQNVRSNYDTDVFSPIIREIETISNKDYGQNEKVDVAIRVIADHVRAVAFSIADGQLPSNNGAGYVIRRILRRAIRYGFTFLNKKEPFIFRLVKVLSEKMGSAFPEIRDQKHLIENVIKEEEASFLRTLDQGLILLDGIIKEEKGKVISGTKAFELYDTYGFPIDLTALILNEKGLTLDEEGFKAELQKQKDRSRAASEVSTDDWTVIAEDSQEEFVGYDSLTEHVNITRYRKVV